MQASITANKWHPEYKPKHVYKPAWPTPQSILRSAVGATEYKFICESVTIDHIRAAVIMPLNIPFYHLLQGEPWGMSYRTADWRMLIVSTLNTSRWIELAQASGAISWIKNHNMSYTYQWEMPRVDEHGIKIRPPNAMGVTAPVLSRFAKEKETSYGKA